MIRRSKSFHICQKQFSVSFPSAAAPPFGTVRQMVYGVTRPGAFIAPSYVFPLGITVSGSAAVCACIREENPAHPKSVLCPTSLKSFSFTGDLFLLLSVSGVSCLSTGIIYHAPETESRKKSCEHRNIKIPGSAEPGECRPIPKDHAII